jgi:hypothetical protein
MVFIEIKPRKSNTVKLSNLMRTKSKSNRTESKTRKNFPMLKVLELSEFFEPNRIEINRIETKSIESNSEYALNSRVSLYPNFIIKIKHIKFKQ